MASGKELLQRHGLGYTVESQKRDDSGDLYCWNGSPVAALHFSVEHTGSARDVVHIQMNDEQLDQMKNAIMNLGLDTNVESLARQVISATLGLCGEDEISMEINKENVLAARYRVSSGWSAPVSSAPSSEEAERGLPYN